MKTSTFSTFKKEQFPCKLFAEIRYETFLLDTVMSFMPQNIFNLPRIIWNVTVI